MPVSPRFDTVLEEILKNLRSVFISTHLLALEEEAAAIRTVRDKAAGGHPAVVRSWDTKAAMQV